jgi:hypothetical protein
MKGEIKWSVLWVAVVIAAIHPWGSLAPGVAVLLAFRSCPICWTTGLIETAGQQRRRRRGPQLLNHPKRLWVAAYEVSPWPRFREIALKSLNEDHTVRLAW